MAHAGKIGLDYFPFDVDFYNDEKIEFLSARFGLKGEAIVIRLLCKIYRNGYYLKWGEDEALLFAKRVGDGCQHTFVNDVVYELVKRGFLNENIFNRFGVLTSKGIQSRFIEATERRKNIEIIREYLLIDLVEYENVNIIPLNVDIKENNVDIIPQSKGKKSKIENKENTLLPEISISDVPEADKKYFEIALTFRTLFINNLSELNIQSTDLGKAKYKNWVDPIRLMFQRDNRQKDELIEVYNFLKNEKFNSRFMWKSVIRSTENLREKFEKLLTESRKQKLSISQPNKDSLSNNNHSRKPDFIINHKGEKISL
jgi:hypothetical protein